MAGRTARQDPLAPIEFIVSLALTLLAAWLVFFGLLTLFGGGHTSLGAWGSDMPCVEVPQTGLTISGGSVEGAAPADGQVLHLAEGVTQGTALHFSLCQEAMGPLDRALASLPILLDMLWTLGFLGLTLRLLRRARRDGLFTTPTAEGVIGLGRYILFGWLLLALVSATMRVAVTSHLVTDFDPWMSWLAYVDWSWATVIAGFGVISVGRVMRQTVPMREEIEATV